MATTIVTKNSSTAAAVPTAAQLVQGELAVNVADKRLFTEDNAGAVVELGTNPSSLTVSGNIDVDGVTNLDAVDIDGAVDMASTLTVTGEITANGGIALGDNDKATFGAGDDLQIYHDGTQSRIVDAGTGNLKIQAQNFAVNNVADDENMITAEPDGFVKLFHNGSEKLATTSTGIDVTGKVSSDGLEVDLTSSGNVELTGAANSNAGLVVRDPTATAYGAHFSYDDANTVVSIGGQTNGTKNTAISIGRDSNDISFYEDTGTTAKFFWDASAESLGIGTSSPSAKFHLFNTDNVAGVYSENSNASFTDSGLFVNNTASTGGNLLRLRSSGVDKLVVLGTGSVGIGTSSPARPLDITDSTSDGSGGVVLHSYLPTVELNDISAGGTSFILQQDGANTLFKHDSTERMRIDSSGNVGIGMSPTGKLSIRPSGTGSEDTHFGFGANLDAYITTGSSGNVIFREGDGAGANTERMRIDSSGNLLVGTTDNSPVGNNVANGIALLANGSGQFSRDGGTALLLNRKTNDGELLRFNKDSSTVGSIGVASNDLNINGGANHSGIRFQATGLYPLENGTASSGEIDLGAAGSKFKNLYLSGGVYLGGTGAANKLDDYEEGTWTPTLGGGATATGMTGTYTKVGRLVTAYLILENSTISGTPDYIVSGLPFTSGANRTALSVTYFKTFNATCEYVGGFVAGNTSTMQFLGMVQGSPWVTAPLTAGTGRYAFATASYQTA